MRMTFHVVPTGKTTATVIWTQDEIDAVRGAPGRARVMLAITFQGRVFRTSVSVYRGEWMMVVNEEMRAGGLTPPGDYEVDVAVDVAERTVDVPDDLAHALAEAGVTEAFDALSFTNRKEAVRGVAEAKRPETRSARIAKVLERLSG